MVHSAKHHHHDYDRKSYDYLPGDSGQCIKTLFMLIIATALTYVLVTQASTIIWMYIVLLTGTCTIELLAISLRWAIQVCSPILASSSILVDSAYSKFLACSLRLALLVPHLFNWIRCQTQRVSMRLNGKIMVQLNPFPRSRLVAIWMFTTIALVGYTWHSADGSPWKDSPLWSTLMLTLEWTLWLSFVSSFALDYVTPKVIQALKCARFAVTHLNAHY